MGSLKRGDGGVAVWVGSALAALALVACTGRSASPVGSTSHALAAPDVNRFLRQASFGATPASVQDVIDRGSFAAWIDNQFTLPASNYPGVCYPASVCDPAPCSSFNVPNCQFEAVTTNRVNAVCPAASACRRDNYEMSPLQVLFYKYALEAPDQLRQRVFFALNQIIVTSGADAAMNQANRMTGFLQILENNAFGNFRDLLYQVTLNPGMGEYLDNRRNRASSLNENYAREIMQLFSIGLYKLDPDGSRILVAGNPVPTYVQQDVLELSRILTGWVLDTAFVTSANPNIERLNFRDPMVANEAFHDTGRKTFLDVTFNPGQTALQDLNQAIDILFNHENTGPFIGKQLIQRLVTSNPSGAYVRRVTDAFNGTGPYGTTRGDLKSVIKAILLDSEARTTPTDPGYGKLLEPVLAETNLIRNFNNAVLSGFCPEIGVDCYDYDLSDFALSFGLGALRMGEDVFRAPTVFNFYLPDNPLPGFAGFVAPEFGINSTTTTLSRRNLFSRMIYQNFPTNALWRPTSTKLDTSSLTDFTDIPNLVERVNQLLLAGTMSDSMRTTVQNALTAGTPQDLVRDAVYLVATSNDYQVQR